LLGVDDPPSPQSTCMYAPIPYAYNVIRDAFELGLSPLIQRSAPCFISQLLFHVPLFEVFSSSLLAGSSDSISPPLSPPLAFPFPHPKTLTTPRLLFPSTGFNAYPLLLFHQRLLPAPSSNPSFFLQPLRPRTSEALTKPPPCPSHPAASPPVLLAQPPPVYPPPRLHLTGAARKCRPTDL